MAKAQNGQMYEDQYEMLTDDAVTYLQSLKEFCSSREVSQVNVKSLLFGELPNTRLGVYPFCDENNLPVELVADSTANGTKIYAKLGERAAMLRGTAFPSLFERLKIAGAALSKIPTNLLIEHLNHYAFHVGGEGRIIFGNGKINAILGKDYRLIPAEQVMEKAEQFFKLDGAAFVYGRLTHQNTEALWCTKSCTLQIPFDTGLRDTEFEQTVLIKTSDCGYSGVNIFPIMRQAGDRNGLMYSLPLRQAHVGNADLQDFENRLKYIARSFEKSVKTITDLANILLCYPTNVLLALMKFLKIPPKYGAVILEKKRNQWKDAEQSAFTIYSALNEVLSLVIGEEESRKSLAEYQERFARGLRFAFAEYDIPGEYDYTDKVLGPKAA